MLFSLFSLNSLCSLLLGMIFNTHEGVGVALLSLGMIFNTRDVCRLLAFNKNAEHIFLLGNNHLIEQCNRFILAKM